MASSASNHAGGCASSCLACAVATLSTAHQRLLTRGFRRSDRQMAAEADCIGVEANFPADQADADIASFENEILRPSDIVQGREAFLSIDERSACPDEWAAYMQRFTRELHDTKPSHSNARGAARELHRSLPACVGESITVMKGNGAARHHGTHTLPRFGFATKQSNRSIHSKCSSSLLDGPVSQPQHRRRAPLRRETVTTVVVVTTCPSPVVGPWPPAFADEAAHDPATGRQSGGDAAARGRAAARLDDLPDHDQPQLRVRADIDAAALFLASIPSATRSERALERTPPSTIPSTRGEPDFHRARR
jgi:hypothetical protein